MSTFAQTILDDKYTHERRGGRKETWPELCGRVVPTVFKSVRADRSLAQRVKRYAIQRKFLPGGRYLYATGLPLHQTNNCFLFRAADSREGWASIMNRSTLALMTGGGIGVNYSGVRPEGSIIRKTRGTSTGPIALMQMVNESARWIRQGGNRRSAVWAGLNWKHRDILKFIQIKNWPKHIRELKEKDFNFPAPMDGTNVSVGLDDDFFVAYHDAEHPDHDHAHKVYWSTIERMRRTGEPGFYIDTGDNTGEDLRNACTEITSADDNDVCNLGSINLGRIDTLEEFRDIVEIASAFLLAGTVYSLVPFHDVDVVRSKNRRIGLGLMGIHEWLLKRGYRYEPNDELATWLNVYAQNIEFVAPYAQEWDLNLPLKGRAIAPNGTIGIVAETTGGIEPITSVAIKRRYLDDDNRWRYQYVVDPVARRIVEGVGTKPEEIEDAYRLACDVERRVAFQAFVQEYVDHGISSTINLPRWGGPDNNKSHIESFGNMLVKHLPKLRGITTYPDGSRGGQPLTAVPYADAMKHEGQVFFESTDVCSLKGGVCGE